MPTDRIKVSQLPLINSASLSKNDVFIINDSDRGDGQTITSGIKYSDVIGSLAQQDINFTGDIVFTGDVLFDGTITPSPGQELNVTLDNITINDSITIDPNANISGIKLSDLDDVEATNPNNGEALVWDFSTRTWVPGKSTSAVSIATSANRPTSPIDGALWFNTDNGIMYVWENYNANWIDVRPGPDGIIQAQGYNVSGGINIENLDSTGVVSSNDQYIVEQTTDQGERTTRSISWQQMMQPLLDRIEELERRVG